MHKLLAGVFATLLCVPASVDAQERTTLPRSLSFPGSVGSTLGNLAPQEQGNVVADLTLEQGVTAWQHGSVFIVGFVRGSLRADTAGYAWNNRTPLNAGVKILKVVPGGVLQLAAGVGLDEQAGGRFGAVPALYASYWAGWQATREAGGALPDAFPGSVSVLAGRNTAAEPRNWVGTVSVEQGAIVSRFGQNALLPFTRVSAGADTEGYAWNNRRCVDAGIKVRRRVYGGVFDLGVAHRQEYRPADSRSAIVGFAELWVGWNPRYAR